MIRGLGERTVKGLFKQLFNKKEIYRVCREQDLWLWEKFKGYKVSESVWKRVPLCIAPTYIYTDPYFHDKSLKSLPSLNITNFFVVELDVDELISSSGHLYPCYYYAFDVNELRNVVVRKYVHIEHIVLMHEFEVFALQDLNIENIKTVYTSNIFVKEFFEKHGIKVKDCDKIDKELFREAFKTTILLRKVYTNVVEGKMPNDYRKVLVRTCNIYNNLLNDWLDKLDVPRVQLEEAIHIPSMWNVVEILDKRAVLYG